GGVRSAAGPPSARDRPLVPRPAPAPAGPDRLDALGARGGRPGAGPDPPRAGLPHRPAGRPPGRAPRGRGRRAVARRCARRGGRGGRGPRRGVDRCGHGGRARPRAGAAAGPAGRRRPGERIVSAPSQPTLAGLPERPLVSIAVPMLDELGEIEACLEGFAVQTYGADGLDVMVIDGGSTDGSREWV